MFFSLPLFLYLSFQFCVAGPSDAPTDLPSRAPVVLYCGRDNIVLPFQDSLRGWYTGDSFNLTDKKWYDLSLNGRDGIGTGTTFSKPGFEFPSAENYTIAKGGVSDYVVFRSDVFDHSLKWSFFFVARHAPGGTRQRIFSSPTPANWLSGFWVGFSGVAYREKWLTVPLVDLYGTNWFIGGDNLTHFRANGEDRQIGTAF